jgi:hypothetical protein
MSESGKDSDGFLAWLCDWVGNHQANGLADERAKQLKENPMKEQQDYAAATKSMLGDYSKANCENAVQACPIQNKAARRQERLDTIDKAGDVAVTLPESERSPINAAASRLRKDMDEVETARAAAHTYLKYGDQTNMPDSLKAIAQLAPEGMLPATDDELKNMGLTQEMLVPPESDFRAAVYKLDPSVWGKEYEERYVVAFRGSTLSKQDWRENMRQGVNEYSEYYKNAVEIGQKISKSPLSGSVQLTGHSLGGGLASAASGGGGLPATTFNSAGLNLNTVGRYAADPKAFSNPANIRGYRTEGEVLTGMQENSLLATLGLAKPAVAGEKIDLPPLNPNLPAEELHSMDNMIAAMEKRKQADEATLKGTLQ